jgi:hypothetical protein
MSAPRRRTAATFTAGASSFMTTTHGTPNARAAYATAWPWLPDE